MFKKATQVRMKLHRFSTLTPLLVHMGCATSKAITSPAYTPPGAPAIAAPQARRPHALSISHDTAFYRKDRTAKASRAHASSDSRDRANATPPPDSTPLAAQVAQNEHEVQELRKKVEQNRSKCMLLVNFLRLGPWNFESLVLLQ